jgi:hypothetical protein
MCCVVASSRRGSGLIMKPFKPSTLRAHVPTSQVCTNSWWRSKLSLTGSLPVEEVDSRARPVIRLTQVTSLPCHLPVDSPGDLFVIHLPLIMPRSFPTRVPTSLTTDRRQPSKIEYDVGQFEERPFGAPFELASFSIRSFHLKMTLVNAREEPLVQAFGTCHIRKYKFLGRIRVSQNTMRPYPGRLGRRSVDKRRVDRRL